MQKQYNYLQSISKQRVFTKVFKNDKMKAWVKRPNGLNKKREEARAL
jgi:hypothetical protein